MLFTLLTLQEELERQRSIFTKIKMLWDDKYISKLNSHLLNEWRTKKQADFILWNTENYK